MARGTNGELVSQGYKLRYVDTIKEANDASTEWPLLRYSQKDSTPGKEHSIFYKFGRLSADNYTSGDNYNAANGSFDSIGGHNANELLKSVRVTPQYTRCPVWQHEDEFDFSNLNTKSPLIQAQMNAMYEKGNFNMLAKLKAIVVDDTYTRANKDGTSTAISIPTKNVFGSDTISLETDTNIKAFRKAAIRLKRLAKNRSFCWLVGEDAESDLMSSDRFTNKDWTTTQTSDGFISKLLHGEVISMKEFDDAFYPVGTETVGYIVGIAKDAIGFSARKEKIQSIIEHVKHKESIYYNTKIPMSIEIIDEEDFVVMKYLK